MKKPPPVPHPWPRLSADLAAERAPGVCQSCGASHNAGQEHANCYREHDDRDRPENFFLFLCDACYKHLVPPHPRLYSNVAANAPLPGCMLCCKECEFREGLLCGHPALKANGGPGLVIETSPPTVIHLNFGGGKGRWINQYNSAPTCLKKSQAELEAAKEQAG